jgi:hypothetical protein
MRTDGRRLWVVVVVVGCEGGCGWWWWWAVKEAVGGQLQGC